MVLAAATTPGRWRASALVALCCWWWSSCALVGAFSPTTTTTTTRRPPVCCRSSRTGGGAPYCPQRTTKTRLQYAANRKRSAKDEECFIDDHDNDIFACLAERGYREDPTIAIRKVMVAEIESLRDSFPSFENDGDTGSNMIKFNKRRRRRPHKHHPLLETTATVGGGSSSSSTELPHNSTDGAAGGLRTAATNGNDGKNGSGASNKVKQLLDDKANTHRANLEYNRVVQGRELVLVDTIVGGTPAASRAATAVSRAFHRAGPRQLLHFDPESVNAAIVTCGGLCPGLNTVIRELVHSLYYLYGANEVWGVTGGFNGFHEHRDGYEPILLTNAMVENIHHEGGTVLRSSRGGFDEAKILKFLRQKKIDQLYVIGGDGTHRAAYKISQACRANDMNVAVAGIPKTIDNDLDYIDRSFGFVSAVEAAQSSIRTAKTEAQCNVPNGIGIIKLMGRSAGFLAAYAALGSGDVDAVLIPEVPIVLDGPNGILPFIRQRLKEQKFAVVVVAEGAGEELLGESTEKDAGGNKQLPAEIKTLGKKTLMITFNVAFNLVSIET